MDYNKKQQQQQKNMELPSSGTCTYTKGRGIYNLPLVLKLWSLIGNQLKFYFVEYYFFFKGKNNNHYKNKL